MKNRLFLYLLLPAVLLLFSYCRKKKDKNEGRSFYMGVTPWPPDFTAKGLELSYGFINENCDLVSHHFDDGIPWEEAYKKLPMPAQLQKEISTRQQKTPQGKKVLLSVAPLDISRKKRAGYYGNATGSVASEWSTKSFTDTAVIQAYVRYVDFLTQALQADFINYGVESNLGNWDKKAFEEYKVFLASVYQNLKALYPNKPIFISFMVSTDKGFLENARQLETFTDWIGLSAYPYSYIGSPVHGSSSPALIPEDLFPSFANINANKPLAIAETGYIAEDLSISGISKEGNEQWQEDYLRFLFSFCEERKAELIVWFCAYDYDEAINTFSAIGYTDPLPQLWKDTGFIDEKLRQRPSLQLWKEWLASVKK